MQRRSFLTLLGGAAARPLAARAQQRERVRRVGVLSNGVEGDPYLQSNLAALREGLGKLNWMDGRSLRTDVRFGIGEIDRIRAAAADLVRSSPDVIVTTSGVATRAAQQATQTIPIVFMGVGDAVANGLVQNIARPESNVTGFSGSEPSVAGKRVELLREAAPQVTRVAILFNPDRSELHRVDPGGSFNFAHGGHRRTHSRRS